MLEARGFRFRGLIWKSEPGGPKRRTSSTRWPLAACSRPDLNAEPLAAACFSSARARAPAFKFAAPATRS
eukprot:3266999-Rhodomonas_salina.1